MTANEMIGSALSNELFQRNMTPSTLALSVGISQYEIENVCNGSSADTSIIKLISRALNVNLFRGVSDMLEKELKK